MSVDTPVLLMAWRRPQTLRQVIDAIRPVAPRHLFVACDGPRAAYPGEAARVAETREVIATEIDWPCVVQRLYSDVNQGCRLGPVRAISWFFDHVEEGIILEDDCVPHPDFFVYCAALLRRYREDPRIWCISGNNFQNGRWRGEGSYYYSRYNHCWGWASWRRCWRSFDISMSSWPNFRDSGLLQTAFEDPVERRYWSRNWQRTHERADQVSWWDYQWMYVCAVNGGLTALPNRNLVSNVGFGDDATHTKKKRVETRIDRGIEGTDSPRYFLRDAAADRYTFDHVFGGRWQRFPLSVIWRLKQLFAQLLVKFRMAL